MKKNKQSGAVDYNRLPPHIGIIMDGNGRWASKRFLPKKSGHTAGAQALRALSEEMNRLGFRMLTIYAFSTENWKRSDEEVYDLMNILRENIRKYIEDSKKNNMRINVIGDISRLDEDLCGSIAHLRELTKQNEGMCVNIAINYGGRDEIIRAIKKLSLSELKTLDENKLGALLDTAEFPDPDIIIRTSGEHRLSNFLPWQSVYSEIFFHDKLWPDFKIDDILEIISHFQSTERRFGGR